MTESGVEIRVTWTLLQNLAKQMHFRFPRGGWSGGNSMRRKASLIDIDDWLQRLSDLAAARIAPLLAARRRRCRG
jgi:hypothetical protein